jgi:hypothetical protein
MPLHRSFCSVGLCLLGILCQRALAFLPVPSKFSGSLQANAAEKIDANRFLPIVISASSADVVEDVDSFETAEVEVNSLHLLNEAIGFNASAASSLLSEISQMREKNKMPREVENDLLSNLLAGGPDAPLPFWSRSKRLARFSRRARMGSLRRTLDMTTPPPSESAQDSIEQSAQRRRRTLVTLLRSLSAETSSVDSKVPAIVSLERKAIQASKEDAESLRGRLPEGLETPNYEIIANRDSSRRQVEFRHYEPYFVYAVAMNKPRPAESIKTDAELQMPEMSGASSFGALAGHGSGTPGIFSMLETLKRHKRQTATQRDKSALLYKNRY